MSPINIAKLAAGVEKNFELAFLKFDKLNSMTTPVFFACLFVYLLSSLFVCLFASLFDALTF
jgi:hypothetical protein